MLFELAVLGVALYAATRPPATVDAKAEEVTPPGPSPAREPTREPTREPPAPPTRVPRPVPRPSPPPRPSPAPPPPVAPRPGAPAPTTIDPRNSKILLDVERTAAILVCEKQPTELPEAPSDLRERGDRNADDWLAWYTFVSLYTLPGSRWVEDGGEPAPWRIVPGWGGENNIGNARWLAVYIRIRAFVGTVKKAERPKTNVEQALGRGAETTSAERTAALSAWAKRSQMTSYPSAPEPAMRTQGSRSAKDWIANVVYWALYADPQSLWVQDGNGPAPWKASGEWAQVWLRIRTYIGTLAADSGKPATPEPGSTLTTAERQAIDSTMWLKLQSADPSVVPPPDNVRKPGTSDVDWYTNYAYWAAYRSPGAEWIQAGNAPAPVTIPAGSVWRPVWLRIRNGVAATLGGG